VRFGLKTEQSRAAYGVLARIWREADEIDSITDLWLFDHFIPLRLPETGPCPEAWTLLTALATSTRRARVGIMVLGNTYRHPALLAKQAAALDIVSGGRLELGLGAGWHEGEHRMYGIPYPSVPDRIRALGEACSILRSLWTSDRTTFSGRYYSLMDAVAEPKPLQHRGPPLTIGGTGERMTLRVAAEHATRWNFNGKEGAEFSRLCGVLDEHCRSVGRDPATIERSVQLHLGPDLSDALEPIADYVSRGARHIVLNPRFPLEPGIAERVTRAVIEPVVQSLTR
jgi:F420-dependent oxidoreductase-like protein